MFFCDTDRLGIQAVVRRLLHWVSNRRLRIQVLQIHFRYYKRNDSLSTAEELVFSNREDSASVDGFRQLDSMSWAVDDINGAWENLPAPLLWRSVARYFLSVLVKNKTTRSSGEFIEKLHCAILNISKYKIQAKGSWHNVSCCNSTNFPKIDAFLLAQLFSMGHNSFKLDRYASKSNLWICGGQR